MVRMLILFSMFFAFLTAFSSCNLIKNPLQPASPSSGATNSGSTNSSSTTTGSTSSSTAGLVLWNKLGSLSEVTNGSFGPGLEVTGTPAYSAGVYGNGIRISNGNYVDISTKYLKTNSGTIEFWATPDVGYASSQRFFFELLTSGGASFGFYLYYNPAFSATQRFYFAGLAWNMAASPAALTNAGTPVHVAMVWDFAGINGTAVTSQIYANGVALAESNNSSQPFTFQTNGTLRLGLAWDGTRAYAGILDNLKIWNYAKTDFSDRFTE